MNKFKTLFILFFLSTFLMAENISTEKVGDYSISTSKYLNKNISRGIVTKWKGDKFNGRDFSVNSTVKNLLNLQTKFNCSTGGVDISAAVLDIPAELQRMFKELFSNGGGIIKELAYQKATEMILNELAGIHYNMVNKTGGNSGLAPYKFLSSAGMASCFSSTLKKSFRSEQEAGAGWNVYDAFSGNFGINFSELLSAIDCINMSSFNTTDPASKEKYAESKRYVRMLFYKILNESSDISFKPISQDCKEFDTEKNKKDEIAYNIACKGTLKNLDGNEIAVGVDSKIVPVGVENTSFANTEGYANSDSKIAKTAEEKNNKIDKYFKSNIKYEAILSKIPVFKVVKDKIDMLDLQSFERMILYRYILDTSINKLKESKFNNLKPKIKNGLITVLKRIFFTSTVNKNKEEDFLCYKYDTNQYCNEKIYPSFKKMSLKDIHDKISNKYLGELKNEIYNWNILGLGIVSLEQLNKLKTTKKYLNTINADVFNMDYEILKQSKENIEKWNMFKGWVAGGSNMLYTDKSLYQTPNSMDLINYINNNVDKLNNAVYLLEPLQELDMANLLYQYSSNIVNIKLLLANNPQPYSYIIQNKDDIKNNFFYLDTDKKYIMTKTNKILANYTYKELETIREYVKMVKSLYIQEYISILMDRMDSVRSWLYNFEKKNYNMTDGMIQYQKVEVEKIKLKIKQRIKTLKLLMN